MGTLTREMDKVELETDEVVKRLKKKRNKWSYIWIAIFFLCDLLVLLAYSIAIMETDWANQNSMQKQHLGWVNSCIILFTDTLLIVWGTLSSKGIFINPLISSCVLLIARILISFFVNQWIIVQTCVFLILHVLFITSWILKYIPVENKDTIKAKI